MSGIDEQERTFVCPNCEDVAYWVLEGQSGNRVGGVLGFLNNPRKSDDPAFEIIKHFKDVPLHTILVDTHKLICGDCGHNLLLNSLMWKLVTDRVKEVWKERVYV